jgi:quinol-cytochrome oxidoreductase complex cytochrome b subunit
MATNARRSTLQSALLYPLDWLEERSGLVGGVKYFLFRKVPRDTSWFHTLGSATLTAFLVQAITGVVLAMYYKPDPQSAYQSIRRSRTTSPSAGSSAACTSGAPASSSS